MRFRAWQKVLAYTLILAALVGLLGPFISAFAGAPVRISLRVQTPTYTLDEQGVRVPGYAWNDAPGAPRLPVYGAIVELPPAGDWRLTYDSAGSRTLDASVEVPAAPVPVAPEPEPRSRATHPEEPDYVTVVDRPDPAIYGTDAFYPASPVVTGDVQWQRGRRLLAVRVFPFQYNPVTHKLRHHPDLNISVLVDVVAPAAAADAAREAASPAVAPSLETSGDTGAVRIRTSSRGMHRLTYDDLSKAGAPVGAGGVNPASFQMQNRGNPVQIQVTGAGDGAFDLKDLVIFYAEPFESRYMAQNVYWLTFGLAPESPEARMGSRVVTGADSASPITTITQTVRTEVNAAYYNDYPLPADVDHWFDNALNPVTGDSVITAVYDLTLDDPLTTGNVSFEGLFYGGKDQTQSPDQSIALRLNNHAVATFQWDGRTGYSAAKTAPASYLDSAPNQIVLEAALDQLDGVEEYWVYPDWMDLHYPAFAEAEDDRIFIEGIDVAGDSAEVAVSGFMTSTVSVYDVRNPRQPVQLAATWAEGASAPYTIHFADSWTAGDPTPSYYLVTEAALLAPALVELDSSSNWRDPPQGYDYIAIVHSSLWHAIDPLLDLRAGQGLRVAKVDVQDIYDEFSDGFVYPPAIREFLSNAYSTWNSAGEALPQYVLLVGDGHYDFKGYSGTTLPNLIPPYLIDIDPWIGETASDNRYVSVDPSGDILPDMAIGRIPARDAADVTAVVDKIVAYEDASDPDFAPNDPWQDRVSYVAGNNADPAGAFHTLSDEARLKWLPDQYDDRTLYWLKDYTDGYALRADTKTATGQSVMLQWFGHASRFAWFADDFDFFGIGSLPNMPDTTQWAFSVDYSCWTGYFVNLYNDYPALGEQMLIYPKRGSVAVLAPSGKHLGSALLTLEQGVTAAVFRDRIREVGKVVDAAKAYYFANSGAWHDVIDTEILFGDPALRLRLPVTLPTVPQVGIAAGSEGVKLSWPHALDSASYEVWRGTTPYFDPALAQGVRVTTVKAGFRGAGPGFESLDDGADLLPPEQLIGYPATNYTWVVRSRNGDGVSGPSNRVGEFDFLLAPGDK